MMSAQHLDTHTHTTAAEVTQRACFFSLRGFSVSTDTRVHIFKPVSVQAMW